MSTQAGASEISYAKRIVSVKGFGIGWPSTTPSPWETRAGSVSAAPGAVATALDASAVASSVRIVKWPKMVSARSATARPSSGPARCEGGTARGDRVIVASGSDSYCIHIPELHSDYHIRVCETQQKTA